MSTFKFLKDKFSALKKGFKITIYILLGIGIFIFSVWLSGYIEEADTYPINIKSVKEVDSKGYIISGTTKAPNGSKIFALDTEYDDSQMNAASNLSENGFSIVKNHKFTALVNPTLLDEVDNHKEGQKIKMLGYAIPKFDGRYDSTVKKDDVDNIEDTGDVTYHKFLISKKMAAFLTNDYNQFEGIWKEAEKDKTPIYKDDLKHSVDDRLSKYISINKIVVNGEFTSKPYNMAIIVYSDEFTENPNKDYINIVNIIREIKKYSPSKFSNIKVVLEGKVGTPYETKYMPIQSYSFSGNVISKIIPDNLDKESLEQISNDHYYIKFN